MVEVGTPFDAQYDDHYDPNGYDPNVIYGPDNGYDPNEYAPNGYDPNQPQSHIGGRGYNDGY